MNDHAWLEFGHYRNLEELKIIKTILDVCEIPYRESSMAPAFDVATIGSTEADRQTVIILSVPKDKFHQANSALEKTYLESPIPEDHHLNHATDDDVIDILGNAQDWNAFDVIHARRIAVERNLDLSTVKVIEDKRERSLKEGKPASRLIMWSAGIGAITGGIVGFLVAYSICTMKDKATGHYVYDLPSRKEAKFIMVTGLVVMILLTILLYFFTTSYTDKSYK
jgi:hypothetical protein